MIIPTNDKLSIIYLTHYFAPDIGAPSARVLEMARQWVADGHTVKVVTCFPHYPTGHIPPGYRGLRFMKETMDGIEVYRNWVYATPNEGVIKRTICHLSFMCSSVLLSTRRVGHADIIIATSPTLFSVVAAWAMSRLKRIPFVFEVRDLWPAAIKELGVLTQPWIIKPLEALEMWLYRKAAAIVNVTHSFSQILATRGIPVEKLYTITNGVDPIRFTPRSRQTAFRREQKLDHSFVVLYIGAHGISQNLGRILDVAEQFRDNSVTQFVFVGEGAEKAQLMRRAQESNLRNVRFLPAVDKERMAELYASADVCLVPLRDVPLFNNFIPSKIFEILACGRPIVASVAGEAANILRESGGALVVAPEDTEAIARAIRRLQTSPTLRAQLAREGHAYVIEHYTRQSLARAYLDILSTLVRPRTVKEPVAVP